MCSVFSWTWGRYATVWLVFRHEHCINQSGELQGMKLQPPEPYLLLWQIHPFMRIQQKKITSKEEDLMLGCLLHPDMSMTLKDLQLTCVSENKLHAGSDPTLWGVLCASTNTHSPPAREMGCTAPDPYSQLSDITSREVTPCLKSKTKLKTQTLFWMLVFPKPAPKLFQPSLASFIESQFVTSYQQGGCIESGGGHMCMQSQARCACDCTSLDEIRTTAQQNCVSWTSVVQRATNDSPSLKDPGIWASGTIHFIFLVSVKQDVATGHVVESGIGSHTLVTIPPLWD